MKLTEKAHARLSDAHQCSFVEKMKDVSDHRVGVPIMQFLLVQSWIEHGFAQGLYVHWHIYIHVYQKIRRHKLVKVRWGNRCFVTKAIHAPCVKCTCSRDGCMKSPR